MADEHKLEAEVLTPEGEVFDGELQQVSTRTSVGEVGILANHIADARPAACRPSCACTSPTREVETLRPGRGLARGLRATAPGCWSRRRIAPEELDAAELQDAARGRRAAPRGGRGGLGGGRAGRARARPRRGVPDDRRGG